jgi:hypothetical protein
MPSTATKTNCSRAKSATTIWQQHQFIAAAAKATKAGTFEESKTNAGEASANPVSYENKKTAYKCQERGK